MAKTKVCSVCNKRKSLDKYYKHKGYKDGRRAACKKCTEKSRITYLTPEKKEKKNATQRVWHANNKEKVRAKVKKWTEENYEHVLELNREWRRKNPGYLKSYRDRHPEAVLANYIKRRDDEARLDANYNKRDVKYTLKLFKNKCFNCGSIEKLCIDHNYPLCKGYALTRQNAVVLCSKCNTKKGSKDPEEFYTKAKWKKLKKLLKIG